MNTIFRNSENSETLDLHKPLLNLLDKKNLKKSDECFYLQNLSTYYTWTNIKSQTKIINLKYHHALNNFNYLTDHIMYQIFKNILSMYQKNMNKKLKIIIILQ